MKAFRNSRSSRNGRVLCLIREISGRRVDISVGKKEGRSQRVFEVLAKERKLLIKSVKVIKTGGISLIKGVNVITTSKVEKSHNLLTKETCNF